MRHTTSSGSQTDTLDKQEIKQDAEALKDSAKQQAELQAERGRDKAVGAANSASSAIDTAADELRKDEDAPDWMAQMLSSAARQIQQVASELDGKSPQQMLASTQQFGRSNPATFLAASAAAGFAAGRFLRVGAEQHDDIDFVSSDRDNPSDHSHEPVGRVTPEYQRDTVGGQL
ncbi:hypothetical protein [Erythrobacter sp.]|jgi:hypothetical protein|uniref:hypothetical protein n=1 Tax=Erythrobacter sp. TaxID=1042 RepID=UPI002E9D1C3C|nr:hypothetical protein [Erythrobacter sp.]